MELLGCKKLMDRNRMQRRETFLTLSLVRSFVRPFAAKTFRRHEKIYDEANFFRKLDRADAINFVNKSSKPELSSQF